MIFSEKNPVSAFRDNAPKMDIETCSDGSATGVPQRDPACNQFQRWLFHNPRILNAARRAFSFCTFRAN
jgi:hypothetical protein